MSGYNVLHYLATAGSALNTKRVVMNGNLSPMEVQTLAACRSGTRKYVNSAGCCVWCICMYGVRGCIDVSVLSLECCEL